MNANNLTPGARLSAEKTDSNMIPLINIVFLLLIFFMVAGQIKVQPNADIRLPTATLEQPGRDVTVRIELTKEGQLSRNGLLETPETLSLWLSTTFPESLDIALFADHRATAEALNTVLNLFRRYPIQSLHLYSEHPRDTQP